MQKTKYLAPVIFMTTAIDFVAVTTAEATTIDITVAKVFKVVVR